MKLSPKEGASGLDDMNKEIRESMQQAQVLFYLLQLHAEDKLIPDVGVDVNPKPSSTINQLTPTVLEEPSTKHQQLQPNQPHQLQSHGARNTITRKSNIPQSEWQTSASNSSLQTTL